MDERIGYFVIFAYLGIPDDRWSKETSVYLSPGQTILDIPEIIRAFHERDVSVIVFAAEPFENMTRDDADRMRDYGRGWDSELEASGYTRA
jgi:hypothetical protein